MNKLLLPLITIYNSISYLVKLLILRIKLVLIVLTIIILFALALPEFTFEFRNETVTYPSIGFSKIGIPTDYGSFRKSKDLFASHQYVSIIDFGFELDEDGNEIIPEDFNVKTELESLISRIQNRVDYTGLYDVDVQYEIKENEYRILITIPEYYEHPDTYAKWLVKRGEIEFYAVNTSANDPESTEQLNIKPYDPNNIFISNGVDLIDQSTNQLQGSAQVKNLIFTFDDDYKDSFVELGLFLQSSTDEQQNEAGVNVDGIRTLVLQPHEKNESWLRGIPQSIEIPLDVEANGKIMSDLMQILRSYFQEEEPIQYDIALTSEINSIAPIFNPDGGTYLAMSFVIGFIFVLLGIVRQVNFKKTFILSMGLIFNILLTIDILKLSQAYLSSGLVVGLMIMTMLNIVIFVKIFSSHGDDFKNEIKNFRLANIILLLMTIALFTLHLNIGLMHDALGVVIAYSFSSVLTTYFCINWLGESFIIKDLSFKELFNTKK